MNVIGRFRSNYFAVKDRTAFEQWCQHNGLQLIVHESHVDLVGFLNSENEAGIPFTIVEEREGKKQEIDIDFMGELGTFLADDHVAVVIEIASEGYRYLTGGAHAINSKGEHRSTDVTDIMARAKQLGKQVTRCEG